MRRTLLLALSALLALALTPSAGAAPGLIVGAADDQIKGDAATTSATAADLGLSAIRFTVKWQSGWTALPAQTVANLDAVIAGAGGGLRLVPVIYSDSNRDAPLTAQSREEYCAFARDLLDRYPTINDVVVWVEPNKQRFWFPQYNADESSAAPAAYTALLAHCYDVLHAAHPDVNLVAASTSPRGNDRPNAQGNVAHSPGAFIRAMGKAFRESGRNARLFDTVGHHVYGEHSSERPWKRHALSSTISQGDLDALMLALYDAYHGTAQPIPGAERTPASLSRPVVVWYLEAGFQTLIDTAHQAAYHGAETDKHPVPVIGTYGLRSPAVAGDDELAPDHGTQLADALAFAYCQPYVEAFFNLMIWDESDLKRWQSGVFWADGAKKPSYGAFKSAIADVNAGRVDCSRFENEGLVGGFVPKDRVGIDRLVWAKKLRVHWKNNLWRFRIMVDEHSTIVAKIVRKGKNAKVGKRAKAGKRKVAAKRKARVVLKTRAKLKRGFLSWVKFKRKRLRPGKYQIVAKVRAVDNAARVTKIKSKKFRVKPRKTRPKRG